jgi:cardiolipin synthase
MPFPPVQWSLLYLISEWLVRIVMLIYVPQRRSPSAARAWLLLIFFLPLPGVILYALVGRIYVPKRRIALQRQASRLIRSVQNRMPPQLGPDVAALPVAVEAAVHLATGLGDFEATRGNTIEILHGYDLPMERLIEDLRAAQLSIHLLYYIFEDDKTGRWVTEVLIEAARRGVRCRVLMDAVGSRSGLRGLAPLLEAAGIEVHALLPVGLFRRNVARFDLRNHRKIVVIDGCIGYTGSQNIVDGTFIPGLRNEELVVRAVGPVVTQLQFVFLADWYFETNELPTGPEILPGQSSESGTIAQVLPSGPGYGRENTKELMISLIYAAHREVVIATPYFVPDEPFLEAVLAAARRGITVRFILPERSNQRVTHWAQQSYYAQLLAAGVQIHLYRKGFLHAKFMTIDCEVSLIGSTNMDIRSFALNAEVSLLAYGPDVVQRLNAISQGYIETANSLSAAAWSRRPLARRLQQNIARLADSLL